MRFPIGEAVTVEALDGDPHPVLRRLREREPVSRLTAIDGWLVTRHALVVQALGDPATFTVEHPAFTTARVVGPSMLSLDGPEHARHRAPFLAPFRAAGVRDRFAAVLAADAAMLAAELSERRGGELRRDFAGPLAARTMGRALGLAPAETPALLDWYEAIVSSVNAMSAGRPPDPRGAAAYAALADRLARSMQEGQSLLAAADSSALSTAQRSANAAILLFGGIETTEGMIANAMQMLLTHPHELARARTAPAPLAAAIEESLRLEPAAAALDRYTTVDTVLGGVSIPRGELVRLSLTAANRDPSVFPAPDRFDPDRRAAGNLAFARGPHVCIGVHLARLEARTALAALLAEWPRLRLDPGGRAEIRGLVFRKPPRLDCLWS